MGQFRPFLFIFIRFTIQLQICKAVDVVDGFEPGAAGWKVRTDPNVQRPHRPYTLKNNFHRPFIF